MQMTQLNELNVVTVSSGLACALTASACCFCNASCSGLLGSVRSTSSTFSTFSSSSPVSSTPADDPSPRFCRFADGPGVGDSLFLAVPVGGESGALVRST